MSSIIKIKDLEKTYITDSEKLTVLKNLNLKIEEGSKIVIVGEKASVCLFLYKFGVFSDNF